MDFSRFGNVRDRLCTYDAKFLPGSLHYEQIELRLPAPLTETESGLLLSLLQDAFRAHRCRDFARMDVRLRDGIFYILDINPNADISSDASMACAAEAAGYSFGAMGSRLLRLRRPGCTSRAVPGGQAARGPRPSSRGVAPISAQSHSAASR